MTSRKRSRPTNAPEFKFPAALQRPNIFTAELIKQCGGDPGKTFWAVTQKGFCMCSWECFFCPNCELPRGKIADSEEGYVTCRQCDIEIFVQLLKHCNFSVTSIDF